MEVLDADNAIPSYRILDLAVLTENIVHVFMYNLKRFYVIIIAENLEGKGNLLNKFKRFRDDIDEPETMFQFEDWVLGALDDFMRKEALTLAPGFRESLTLFEYLPTFRLLPSPSTFAFYLVKRDGKLCPTQQQYDPELHARISPRTRIIDSSKHRE